MKGDLLLNPEDDVVTRPLFPTLGFRALRVPQVVIQADMSDATRLEESDHLIGPPGRSPARGAGALVVQVDLHR
jgi:hypothetical protein